MSKLEHLEEELYGKEEGPWHKRMKRRVFFPRRPKDIPTSWIGREEKPVLAPPRERRLLKLFAAGMLFVVLLGGAIFLFLYLGTRGSELLISFPGRNSVEAGETIILPVVFKNMSNVPLKDAELVVTLPSGTSLVEEGIEKKGMTRLTQKLKDIGPRSEESIEFRVRFFGREREEKEVRASILYRPENLRARFSADGSKKFMIVSVPVALSWDVPSVLSGGQETEIKINYTSHGRVTFDDLSLQLEYPPGFQFISSSPEPVSGEENLWQIGNLEPGKGGTIAVRGIIAGEEGEIKAFRAGVGIWNDTARTLTFYTESSRETKIAVTPLAVKVSLLGVAKNLVTPGDQLQFAVRYRNNTAFALRNVTVKSQIFGEIVDFSTLSLGGGGVFDAPSRSIIWGPGNVFALRSLAPAVEGEFTFFVMTRAQAIMRSSDDKNLTVNIRSAIEPAGIPQELQGTDLRSEDTLQFKVRTKVIFTGRTRYRSSPLKNTGPLPPRVGQETTYTMFLDIRNFTNDLQNAEVRVPIPPNVRWLDSVSGKDQAVTFQQDSGEVIWRIGNVEAGTGVIKPALTLAFQVAFTPSEADAGKVMVLAAGASFAALDTFTGETISQRTSPFTTELRDDASSNQDEWGVVR